VYDRISHDHFRVEKRTRRQLPMQEPAVTIRPVDHGRDGEDFSAFNILICHCFSNYTTQGHAAPQPSWATLYHE
jgi:hypothetical protein